MVLVRALYGHPDAGGLWEEHLKKARKTLGGSEVHESNMQGISISRIPIFFSQRMLTTSPLVDPQNNINLSGLIRVERPEPIYRILGRNHVSIGLTKEGIFTKNAAITSYSAMAFGMSDYAQQTAELYKSIAKVDKLQLPLSRLTPAGF